MKYAIKPLPIIVLSIVNLLIYLLVINGLIKFARETIFYVTGIYVTFGIVLLTILYMIIKRKYGAGYWIIFLINTLVFIWAYSYLQNALLVR